MSYSLSLVGLMMGVGPPSANGFISGILLMSVEVASVESDEDVLLQPKVANIIRNVKGIIFIFKKRVDFHFASVMMLPTILTGFLPDSGFERETRGSSNKDIHQAR